MTTTINGVVEDPYEKLIAALTIFQRYPHEHGIQPGHDQIWAGPDPKDVSKQDLAALKELGWDPDNANDCFQLFT